MVLLCGEELGAVSCTRKIAIRKGGRLVAIGTRNICSTQLENGWEEIFLKGPLAHEMGARKVGFPKKTGGPDPTLWPGGL